MQFNVFQLVHQEEKDLLQFPDPKLCCITTTVQLGLNQTYRNTGDFRKVVAGQDAYVAMSNATNTVSFSYDGESWVTRSTFSTDNWVDIAFGNGYFIMIAEGSNNVKFKSRWINMTAQTIPLCDDPNNCLQWQKIEYGAGRFVGYFRKGKSIKNAGNGSSWTLYPNAYPQVIMTLVDLLMEIIDLLLLHLTVKHYFH